MSEHTLRKVRRKGFRNGVWPLRAAVKMGSPEHMMGGGGDVMGHRQGHRARPRVPSTDGEAIAT